MGYLPRRGSRHPGAQGVLVGDIADAITRRLQGTTPIYIDVTTERRYAQADVVVIRFPDRKAADGWHSSAAYQALVPLRRQAADVVLLAYDE